MNSNGYIKMKNVQRHQSPRDLTLEEDLMCHIASLKIYSEDLSLVDCFDIQDTLILHVNRPIGTYFMRLDVLQRFNFIIFSLTYMQRTLWNWTAIAPLALTIVIFMVQTLPQRIAYLLRGPPF